MKKVLFSLFLFSAMAVGVQAQSSSCSKACTAKPAGSACEMKSASSADANAAAAKLASTDSSIEAKTCPGTSAVCYVRKVSEKNGKVSYVDVSYDATTNTFVNVSPVKGNKEASCAPTSTSASGKGCCAPGATSVSGSKTPACCAGKGKTATATSGTTTTTTTTAAPSKG
jgi:hypothetical protein